MRAAATNIDVWGGVFWGDATLTYDASYRAQALLPNTGATYELPPAQCSMTR